MLLIFVPLFVQQLAFQCSVRDKDECIKCWGQKVIVQGHGISRVWDESSVSNTAVFGRIEHRRRLP